MPPTLRARTMKKKATMPVYDSDSDDENSSGIDNDGTDDYKSSNSGDEEANIGDEDSVNADLKRENAELRREVRFLKTNAKAATQATMKASLVTETQLQMEIYRLRAELEAIKLKTEHAEGLKDHEETAQRSQVRAVHTQQQTRDRTATPGRIQSLERTEKQNTTDMKRPPQASFASSKQVREHGHQKKTHSLKDKNREQYVKAKEFWG